MKEIMKLLNKSWKVVVAFVGGVALVWGVFEGVYMFTDWFHTNEDSKTSLIQRIEKAEATLSQIINEDKKKDDKIQSLEDYRNHHKQSFAVGFRMFKVTDEDTGTVKWVKRYRDWSGEWKDIFRDEECSEYIGLDCYFYYGTNGERIYRSQ